MRTMLKSPTRCLSIGEVEAPDGRFGGYVLAVERLDPGELPADVTIRQAAIGGKTPSEDAPAIPAVHRAIDPLSTGEGT